MEPKFTRPQTKAILKFLITFAHDNNVIKDDHALYLMQLQQKMDFITSDLSEGHQMDTTEAIIVLRNLSPDNKTIVGYIFHQMMKLDGSTYQDKYKNIKILFSGIGISTF